MSSATISVLYRARLLVEGIGSCLRLVSQICTVSLRQLPSWNLVREQLYQMGVLSSGVVALAGLITGGAVAAQSFYQLGNKGLAIITGALVTKSMLMELGPLLAAIMVTGRVGASMCAEIGSMKVTEQIDALHALAIHPIRYLIAPRFLAGIIVIPSLTLLSAAMGILGGYLIAILGFNMPSLHFFYLIPKHVSLFDLTICMTKSIVFAMILVSICCYKGLTASGGAAGVGKATTQSVVTSYVVILLFNLLLTITLHR